MKKSTVGTILAMSLILAGTGYAYWTDSLQVTTRATTGDMEVTFADLGLYAQYTSDELDNTKGWSIIDGIGEKGYVDSEFFRRNVDYNIIAKPGSVNDYYANAAGYNNVNFNAELVGASPIDVTVGDYAAGQVNGSDEIAIDINKMYPGYAQAFRSDVLNVGSIGARLSNIKFEVGGIDNVPSSETTKKMLGVALLVEREYQTPGEDHKSVFELAKAMGLGADDVFELGKVQFIRLAALDQVSKDVLEEYADLLAVPNNNRMDVFVAVAMDPDAEGVYTTGSTSVLSDKDDSLSQNSGATVKIKFLWDQFNQGKDVDTTNILKKQNQ